VKALDFIENLIEHLVSPSSSLLLTFVSIFAILVTIVILIATITVNPKRPKQ